MSQMALILLAITSNLENGCPLLLGSEVISKETLNSFILQMEKKYPSIYKGISHLPSIQKAQNIEAFDNLIPGSLVNVVAVVLSISIERAKEKDEFQHPVARIGKF